MNISASKLHKLKNFLFFFIIFFSHQFPSYELMSKKKDSQIKNYFVLGPAKSWAGTGLFDFIIYRYYYLQNRIAFNRMKSNFAFKRYYFFIFG